MARSALVAFSTIFFSLIIFSCGIFKETLKEDHYIRGTIMEITQAKDGWFISLDTDGDTRVKDQKIWVPSFGLYPATVGKKIIAVIDPEEFVNTIEYSGSFHFTHRWYKVTWFQVEQ